MAKRDSDTKKRTNKGWESVFFFFQIPLSHNNNHLTAPCGLAAASDVEAEREKGGGGGKLMRLDSDQSRTLQCSTLNNWQISHHSTPLCLIGPLQSVRTQCRRAHTHAFPSFYIWAWPWSSLISAIISQWSQCTRWKSVDLAVHNFCSRFDSESRRNVRKKI